MNRWIIPEWSYFRRPEINFSSKSPNPPSFILFAMRQPSGKETKKRKWVTLKCKHWEGTELPLKTEIDAKESTFHLSGWNFFPRPSPCSIIICEQKKQWIRHRIDKLVLHSGIRKYCLLRRCFQPTSVIKWGIARGFHMKDKSILNLLTLSRYSPRHHPTIFTWRSSPPHHERAV